MEEARTRLGRLNLTDGTFSAALPASQLHWISADRGIYYYTTYDNHQISAVDMHRTDLDGAELTRYPLIAGEQIRFQN